MTDPTPTSVQPDPQTERLVVMIDGVLISDMSREDMRRYLARICAERERGLRDCPPGNEEFVTRTLRNAYADAVTAFNVELRRRMKQERNH